MSLELGGPVPYIDANYFVMDLNLACNMNVHKRCQKNVANNCGINTKEMAEILNAIGVNTKINQRKKKVHRSWGTSTAIGAPLVLWVK